MNVTRNDIRNVVLDPTITLVKTSLPTSSVPKSEALPGSLIV